MGEENLETNDNNNNGGGENEGNNKNNNEKKKESGSINVVFKVNMHCEGCVTKLIKCARSFNGVESVKAESENSKLTVTGRVDPVKLHEKLMKAKKEIQLISPLPKKENKNDAKSNVKAEPKIKEPPVTTAVLKLIIHCHGCFEKIQKTTSKFKGVHSSSIDQEKDLITVTGTMDVKALQAALKEKVKRPVEIVPPKKEKDGSGDGNGEGKNQKGGGGGGKKVDNGGNVGGGKTEVNLMQYYYHGYEYGPGYFVEPVHPPQLFSDENPNACTVM